jgi:hypothetical protein
MKKIMITVGIFAMVMIFGAANIPVADASPKSERLEEKAAINKARAEQLKRQAEIDRANAERLAHKARMEQEAAGRLEHKADKQEAIAEKIRHNRHWHHDNRPQRYGYSEY